MDKYTGYCLRVERNSLLICRDDFVQLILKHDIYHGYSMANESAFLQAICQEIILSGVLFMQ